MSEVSSLSNRRAQPSATSFHAGSHLSPGTEIAAFALIGVFIGAVVPYQSTLLTLGAPLIALAVVATTLHLKVRLWTLSPVALLVVTYFIIGLAGPFTADAVATGIGVGARITLFPFEEHGAYLVFTIAATSAASGALAYAVARPNGWLRVNRFAIKPVTGSARIRTVVAVLSLGPLALEVIRHGTGLLVRDAYLVGYIGDPVIVAASTLALPAVAVLGWLSQASYTPAGKIASWVGIVLYATVLFALATRAFALLPVMAALGMIAARPGEFQFRAALFAAAIGSVLLLELPLSLRGGASHGLIPYLAFVAQGNVAFDLSPFSNVLSSFQLTGRVAFGVPPLPFSDLLISLDPRPGQLVGWYDIEPLLRLNVFTPYNALGELANYGWLVLVVFFFCTGVYLGHIDRSVRRLIAAGQALPALLLFGLACLFTITTLQYNLRSNVRILYYMVALDVAIVALRWLGTRRERSDKPMVPAESQPQPDVLSERHRLAYWRVRSS